MNGTSYVGSPYNFVRLPQKTHAPLTRESMEIHDRIDDELMTGEIEYTITAQTPVFVDNGKEQFFRNEYGTPAIPGSTMRGLLRNNAQILSSSDLDGDIDDYRLMYRNVAAGALKKEYNNTLGNRPVPYGKGTISVLQNVKAGAITCEKGKYYIYPTKINQVENNMPNYYVLSERTVVDAYLKDKNSFPYDLFVQNGQSIMQHKHDQQFKKYEKNGRMHYKGEENRQYKPYFMDCSYESKGKNITAVSTPDIYVQKGVVISSGKMQEKKAIYIIPEIDDQKEKRIEIPKEDIRAYQIDYKRKENQLRSFFNAAGKSKAAEEAERFFGLPAEGKTKPVFYIQMKKDSRLYFGFTPRLRLFYEHPIKNGYSQMKADVDHFDLATSLFGLSDPEKGSFKSKVSFSDAVMTRGKEAREQKIILAEPKPTSYLDYLVQSGGGRPKTYEDKDFELRGIKQYWLRGDIYIGNQNQNNENVGSCVRPMDKGATFCGRIRFSNLTKQELGLLLWSLRLEPQSHMNVGKGKPYGYGHIKISGISAKVVDNHKAYDMNQLSLDPFKAIDTDVLIDAYKNTEINGKKVVDLPSVKDFFAMKDSDHLPDGGAIRYMSIDNREYQSRTKDAVALPTIEETLGAKPQNRTEERRQTEQRNTQNTNRDNNRNRKVRVTSVKPDNKNAGQYVALFQGGMAFRVPPTVRSGDEITIRVTGEKDNRVYGEYVK